MFIDCKWGQGGVVLFDGFVDADVFKLSKAVFLVYLNNGQGACDFVGEPHVFEKEVGDRDGL